MAHPFRTLFLTCILFGLLGAPMGAQSPAAMPPWAEPRALHISDLAGQVPDDVLEGHIVCYGGSGGLSTYLDHTWEGAKLRLRVRLYPRYDPLEGGGWHTTIATLGHGPAYDHMSSSSPASWVRIYQGGADVTDAALAMNYTDPELRLPVDPRDNPRYATADHEEDIPRPIPADGIYLPANWGGYVMLDGRREDLTAMFTFVPSMRPSVTYLGQESVSYPSYIGTGNVGWFASLMDQMRSRYPERHPRMALNPPPNANYVLFVYEPMPYDVYAGMWKEDRALFEANRTQPIGGTVRLAYSGGMLSQDLTHGGPFPFRVWWQDADQSAGPYLSVFTTSITQITPPEFVVLPGTPYSACFVDGGCSSGVLDDVYNRRAMLTVVYLQVEPILQQGLIALPLRVADTNWHPGLSATPERAPAHALAPGRSRVLLPLIWRQERPPIPIEIPAERPVGFFEPGSGRMLGYWAE
ncbi:MAG: hypothetical protein JXA74_04630 [Anaerolineae bacterium]|nr:hypothetical protein [Anaerolineae bacterium]